MKEPAACSSLEEVRAQIDALDEQIIGLIGKRAAYGKAASKFKTSEAAVRAPERLRALMRSRREMAARVGVDPVVIEHVYKLLVEYLTNEEVHHWKQEEK